MTAVTYTSQEIEHTRTCGSCRRNQNLDIDINERQIRLVYGI